MKELIIKKSFNKDLKDVERYKEFNKNKLYEYVKMIQQGETLPERAKDHKLALHSRSEYRGCRDFHLSPDIVVVYRLTQDAIELIAIGKHNKLQLTSSWNYFRYNS